MGIPEKQVRNGGSMCHIFLKLEKPFLGNDPQAKLMTFKLCVKLSDLKQLSSKLVDIGLDYLNQKKPEQAQTVRTMVDEVEQWEKALRAEVDQVKVTRGTEAFKQIMKNGYTLLDGVAAVLKDGDTVVLRENSNGVGAYTITRTTVSAMAPEASFGHNV